MGAGADGVQVHRCRGQLQALAAHRPVTGVRARSRLTSSLGLCCWYALLQLQGLAVGTYIAVEAREKDWGSGRTGA